MSAALLGYGPIDTVVCDIDGVLLLGNQPIPGAREALTVLSDAGLDLTFATNNSTRKPSVIREHIIDVVGFDPGPDAIVNSGVAAARFMLDKVEQVFVLGSDGLRETLRDGGISVTADWRQADAVVTGIDFTVTYEALAQAGLAVQNGATFYATNSDVAYPRPDGLYPGAGALTAVVERTTGQTPITCGKPFPPMRAALESLTGARPLIVGDRPDTDIALGKAEGWATALVMTGVVEDLAQVPSDLTPDVVLRSFADLPAALELQS